MMQARTAVVVEDDRDLGDAISQLLAQAGFDTVVASSGAEALEIVRRSTPDLVTLDLSLPDIDGVEVCRRIRTVSDCYVIVISGRSAEVDRLIGLEVGADDYLVKPFSMRELQARVAALFRRPRSTDALVAVPVRQGRGGLVEQPVLATQLGCEDLTLDEGAREVLVKGEEVGLTRTEFDLLAHLVNRPGVVIARDDLMRAVWANDYVPDSTHVVDVHLANVRRKLGRAAAGNQWIRTIRGVGFRFDPCCS